MELTKEEIKAVKKGKAYKTWNRKRSIIIVIFLIWAFGGIALININSIMCAIYSVGLLISMIAMFCTVKFSCWKCTKCNNKLPSKTVSGGAATVNMPILVKKCPHCDADLTQ